MKKLFTLVLTLILATTLVACGGGETKTDLRIGQALYEAHGTKAWATATVVMDGDKVVLAFIDEYQFMAAETTVGVPNSEPLADYVTEGYVLGSKRVNNETYSANMAGAGSTVELADNYNYVQDFVKGKTITELEEIVAMEKEAVVDLVTGATVVDAQGYINTILLAAKAAQGTEAVAYAGKLEDLKINQLEGAAHGTKCFTLTTVVTDGTNIVLSHIDEFQYMDSATTVGVPNSENFVDYIIEGRQLVSKRVNNDVYSANMAEAGSTVAIAANYDFVQAFANGKTIAELKELDAKTPEEVVDLVTGATVVDAQGYLAEIVRTAGSTK